MSVSLSYTSKSGNHKADHDSQIGSTAYSATRDIQTVMADIAAYAIRKIEGMDAVNLNKQYTVAFDNTSSKATLSLTPSATTSKAFWGA